MKKLLYLLLLLPSLAFAQGTTVNGTIQLSIPDSLKATFGASGIKNLLSRQQSDARYVVKSDTAQFLRDVNNLNDVSNTAKSLYNIGGSTSFYSVQKDMSVPETAPAQIASSAYVETSIIGQFGNGQYWILYLEGVSHTSGGTIKIITSSDGATYSAPTTVIAGTGGQQLSGFGAGVTPTGRLILLYTHLSGTTPVDIYEIYSDDNGVTWSTPVLFVNSSGLAYGRVIPIGNNKLLAPYFRFTTPNRSYVKISSDNGSTWGAPVLVSDSTLVTNETSYSYLGGSTIVALGRTSGANGQLKQFISLDNGSTWALQGSTTFDASPLDKTAPEMTTWLAPSGRRMVTLYYANRSSTATMFAITASAQDLINNGVSAWNVSTLTGVATLTTNVNSGYPSVIHPNNSEYALGAYYFGNGTVTNIKFFTYPATGAQPVIVGDQNITGSYKVNGVAIPSGTVTSVSVTTANGVSGSVATATTTPAITLTLGAITPSSVTAPTLNLTNGAGTTTVTGSTANETIAFPALSGTVPIFASTPTSGGIVAWSGTAGALTNYSGVLGISNGGTGNTSGTATINANLTGVITGTGNTTSITSQTGTGTKFVVDTSPTLITPVLGVASGTSLAITGTAGAGFINLPSQSSNSSAPISGVNIFSNNSANRFSWVGTNGFATSISSNNLTANSLFNLPNISGATLALNPTQNKGDIIYSSNSTTLGLTTLATLGIGTTGQFLNVSGSGIPAWTTALASTVTATTQSPNTNNTTLSTTGYTDAGLALKANLASPTFTGTPILPTGTIAVTQSPSDNSTKVATTAYVDAAVTAAVPTLASGHYTPTITNGTNVASSSLISAYYIRVANIVQVEAVINVQTTLGANTATAFDISLPVASNIGASTDVTGGACGAILVGSSAAVATGSGNIANDRSTFTFNSSTAGISINFSVHFQYTVI